MAAVRFRFRPLVWTGPITPADQRRSRYQFKATHADTLRLLDRELLAIDAAEAVIEADFRPADIRLDGMPRANARQPQHPGVRLAFDSMHGPLIYQTDAYELWRHNLRAIALGLEALRKVDRYGITRRGEQYRGWTAIGAAPAPVTTREAAAESLARIAGWDKPPDIFTMSVVETCYREAARRCHPDTGGSTAQFQELQRIVGILRGGA